MRQTAPVIQERSYLLDQVTPRTEIIYYSLCNKTTAQNMTKSCSISTRIRLIFQPQQIVPFGDVCKKTNGYIAAQAMLVVMKDLFMNKYITDPKTVQRYEDWLL